MNPSNRTEPADPAALARAERERIDRVYDDYQRSGVNDRAWRGGPASQYMREIKWRHLAAMVEGKAGWSSPGWALDLGPGHHSELADPEIGARPRAARIVALDLRSHCAEALSRQPGVRAVLGNASFLPLATASATLVYQSVMLSSVVDPDLRSRIYAELARVIAPGGLFVSYDVRYRNPWNPNTRPISLGELRRAFAGWRQWHRTLTGIPQVLRVLAPRARVLCTLFETVPAFRSHRLFVAEKPTGSRGARAAE